VVSREIWRSLSEPEVVAMLDRVTDGVAVLDSAWRFGYVNEPAAELLRRTREELLGRSIWSQFPDPAAGEPFLRSFEEAVHERRAATVTAFYPPLSRWFESRCFPREDTLLVMFRDITGRRLVEEQLREYTDRMSEAERIAQFGVWRWELGSARVRWSDELHRIYGVAPGEFGGTVEAFISFLHPDDRERVWNAIDRAVVKLEPFAFEERIVRADGQTRVLFSQGRVIAGPDGTAAALVGVCHDVTERSEAERDETVLIRDGEERTYVTVTFALPDAAGRPVERCTIGTDVTERRERESQRQERRDWAHRIESALREDRMLVCAQPVVDLASGEPEGYELLVRLQVGDDPGAILQPAAFLPQAERFGLIQTIDTWMVGQALGLAGRLAPRVNLSAITLCDADARTEIVALLSASPDAAQRIVFEITETATPEVLDAAARFATELTRFGCGLSLDDFGTGFGSFTYLRVLPLRYLKIDRSFVTGLPGSLDDQRVVRSIIGIAEQSGCRRSPRAWSTPRPSICSPSSARTSPRASIWAVRRPWVLHHGQRPRPRLTEPAGPAVVG
jgi:PAS domain S-box-containing protein